MTRIPSLRLLMETPKTDPESGINLKKQNKKTGLGGGGGPSL